MQMRDLIRIIVVVALLIGFSTALNTGAVGAGYVFHSGFELSDTNEWGSVVGATSVQGVNVHTGSYALRTNSDAACYVSSGDDYSRVSVWIDGVTLDTAQRAIIGSTSSGLNLRFDLTGSDVDLYLFEGVVSRGSTTGGVFSENSGWHRICIAFDDPSDSAKVYVDGVEVISSTSISGSIGTAGRIGICETPTFELDIYFDDFICDTTDSVEDLGDLRVLASLPNADGYHDDWTAVGNSTDKWENVNELPVNTADYNWWDCEGSQVEQTHSTVDCTPLGLNTTDTVEAVSVWWYYWTNGGGVGDYASLVRDNTTDYFDWTIDDSKSDTWLNRYDATRPSGGNWTQSAFDDFEIGMATDDANKDIKMYEAVAMVAYEYIPVVAYNVIVTSTGTTLYEDLAPGGNITWGLELWTPTEFLDGAEKTGTITLTAILAT